jgi:hypothetical protein
MYGRREAQVLLDAFDKIWENPILSADFVIDVWKQALQSHKSNLSIAKKSGTDRGSSHYMTAIDETKRTLEWLSRIHDERVNKYY